MHPLQGISLVIPAYNPSLYVMDLVKELLTHGFENIIIVNDGSSKHKEVFEKLTEHKNVILLHHDRNKGKGAALKTAFKYILSNVMYKTETVITMDADGQHSIEDVKKIASKISSERNALILGVRDFSGTVPLRSRFGNTLTKLIFRLFRGINLKDTQTGLRGIPIKLVQEYLKIRLDRYDFELACLLLVKRLSLDFIQVPIQTIYIDNNASSHFRPLIDSLRIYFVFLRYSAVSIVCFALDIISFSVLFGVLSDISLSTYLARIISGSINFYSNKYVVFRSYDNARLIKELISYVSLAVLTAMLSAALVERISHSNTVSLVSAKVVVDLSLFLLNFLVQRCVIFRA
jgi:glycosyltransferase involved in cell wall biosynthesis